MMKMTITIKWTRKDCGYNDDDGNDDVHDDSDGGCERACLMAMDSGTVIGLTVAVDT